MRAKVMLESTAMRGRSEDHIVDCGDGVRLLAHHTPPNGNDRSRVVVLIHGWEGSAKSTYMLSLAARLWEAGYRVIRLNLRDHGDSHHLNEGIFHSCRLAEVVEAVRWVQCRYPEDAMVLGGYSLGANFALRVAAGAPKSGLRIDHVVAVCPVIDPARTLDAIDRGLWFYRFYYIRRWRRSLTRKKTAFPDLYDFDGMEHFNYLGEMTDHFVRHYTEYPNLQTYLNGYALTGNRLAGLCVPSTMLLTEDDPVIPIDGFDEVAATGSLRLERVPFGGHCGFIDGYGSRTWLNDYFLDAFESAELAPNLRQRAS